MTPEEYIKNSTVIIGLSPSINREFVEPKYAIDAIEMARDEIKEKAIMTCRQTCEFYNDGDCGSFDDPKLNDSCLKSDCKYIKDFIKKLNK